jgi:hypothetical protein
MVPDGITEVTVVTESGSSPTTKVMNNAYFVSVSLDQSPSAVRFSGEGGTVVMPAGEFAAAR